jgi:hypothetical protein
VVLAWVFDVVSFVALAELKVALGRNEAREIREDLDDTPDDSTGIADLSLGQVLALGAWIAQVSLVVEVLCKLCCMLRIPAKTLGATSREGVLRE